MPNQIQNFTAGDEDEKNDKYRTDSNLFCPWESMHVNICDRQTCFDKGMKNDDGWNPSHYPT